MNEPDLGVPGLDQPAVETPEAPVEPAAPLSAGRPPLPAVHDRMLRQVETKESRKLRAREEGTQSAWFGLGMFGMVGWSVAVPTVLGVLLGMWIDQRWPSPYSFTLMFLLAGLALGCFSAWRWVSQERSHIERRDRKGRHDR
jgi:ATP synthase protein I